MAEEAVVEAPAPAAAPAAPASPAPAQAPKPEAAPAAAAAVEPVAKPAAAPAPFPDDWRQQYVTHAKGDDKLLKRLERYTSPHAALDALIAAQNKIASGELKAPTAFPDKGTDDEKAAWRRDNGLPEAPEKYDLKFDDGFVIGDEDKPLVDKFLKAAHEANMAPAAVKTAVKWYFDEIESRAKEQLEQNENARHATEDALHAEWGGDYRRNIAFAKALVQMMPPEIQTDFHAARMPNGTALFNNVDFVRWFAGIARELNPAGVVVPGDGQSVATHIDERIAEIEGWMKAPRASADGKKYWKDNKVQEEYRSLLDQRQRMGGAK